MTANTDGHTCSYYCERPECVRRQRDELRERMESVLASAPPSAPVGAEGFDKRFAEMLLGILSDVQDELGFTDEDKLCANGSAEIVAEIRELKRAAALAQQPAETSNARGEWVLVPVKPTEAMREAFHDWRPSAGGNYAGAQSVNSQARWEFRQRYAAMLAAAPSPAAAPHQPVGVNEAMVERAVAAVMSAPSGVSVEAYVRIVLEAALAKQPAACVGCEGKPAPENSPCAVCGQQPAAVDEAAAIRAFEEHFEASAEDPYFEGELELWLTAWRNALAAQQGGRADG